MAISKIKDTPATAKVQSERVPKQTADVYNPVDQYICLCSDIGLSAEQTGLWDMWLTLSGGIVFSPCETGPNFGTAEVTLADFCQTQKINRSDAVVIVTHKGTIPSFIMAWINHALGAEKPVYTTSAIERNGATVQIRGCTILRELILYRLTRKGLEDYLSNANGEENMDPIPQGIRPPGNGGDIAPKALEQLREDLEDLEDPNDK